MENLEPFENAIFTSDSLEKILDEHARNYYNDEKKLNERFSNCLADIYLSTYKNKIDEVLKQLKTKQK